MPEMEERRRGMGSIDFSGLIVLGLVIGAVLGIALYKIIEWLWAHLHVGWR